MLYGVQRAFSSGEADVSENANSWREDVRRQFISTQLYLAFTFCEIALAADDPEKVRRNAVNARQAYESAAHALKCDELKSAECRTIAAKFLAVEGMLAKITQGDGHEHCSGSTHEKYG